VAEVTPLTIPSKIADPVTACNSRHAATDAMTVVVRPLNGPDSRSRTPPSSWIAPARGGPRTAINCTPADTSGGISAATDPRTDTSDAIAVCATPD
jgi:hypothetical protein